MLLFKSRFHAGLVDGSISLTFRLWSRARVRKGSMQRCHPIGVLAIEDVTEVRLGDVTADEARAAGFASREELLGTLSEASDAPLVDDTSVFRVALRYAGDNDRAPTADDAHLDAATRASLRATLARHDVPTPWTRATLELIAARPRVAASELARSLGRETPPFKTDVVKLKKLGLTESFSVGYALTPRGEALLAALRESTPPAHATAASLPAT